ncbi:hypothetical protein PIB30_069816, partial [Stylosanthes scabra]|nr:hypothetical protein [Stylosanthes scabra]
EGNLTKNNMPPMSTKEDTSGEWTMQRPRRARRQQYLKPRQATLKEGRDEVSRGTRRDWETMERNSHSVFVDNLPMDIAKGLLYKIFGWVGGVTDVYVSRKTRKGTSSAFAFVQFDAKGGGADRAVQKLNGVSIGTRRMVVKVASFGRNNYTRLERIREYWGTRMRKEGIDNMKMRQEGRKRETTEEEVVRKKENRKSGKPIKEPPEFRRAMERVMDGWRGQGGGEESETGRLKILISYETEAGASIAEGKEGGPPRLVVVEGLGKRWDPLVQELISKNTGEGEMSVDHYYLGGEVLLFEKSPIITACMECMGNSEVIERYKGGAKESDKRVRTSSGQVQKQVIGPEQTLREERRVLCKKGYWAKMGEVIQIQSAQL